MLAPVAARFPQEPTVPYNLACYACQLGRLSEAGDWLTKSYALGDAKAMKLRALDDPDLEPFWRSIEANLPPGLG